MISFRIRSSRTLSILDLGMGSFITKLVLRSPFLSSDPIGLEVEAASVIRLSMKVRAEDVSR